MFMDEKSTSVREYIYNDDTEEKLSISFIYPNITKTRLTASKSSESRSSM